MSDDAIDRVALWDAITAYVRLCGGDPRSVHTRQSFDLVARIEAVVSTPQTPKPSVLSESQISGLWKEAKGDEFHAVMVRFARAIEQATLVTGGDVPIAVKQALVRFGGHAHGCTGGRSCTCGFDEALRAAGVTNEIIAEVLKAPLLDYMGAAQTIPHACNNCRHRWDRKGMCMHPSLAEWDEQGGRAWSEPTVKPPWCPGWEGKT